MKMSNIILCAIYIYIKIESVSHTYAKGVFVIFTATFFC